MNDIYKIDNRAKYQLKEKTYFNVVFEIHFSYILTISKGLVINAIKSYNKIKLI